MLHLIFIFVLTLVENVDFVYTQPNNSIGEESILANVSPDIEPRIQNAHKASLGQFPWVVFIRMRDSQGTAFCAGTLVSKRHVLTAGHCCDSKDTILKSIRVRVGELDLTMDPDCKWSILNSKWLGFGCNSYIKEYRVEKAKEFRINDKFPNNDLCILKTTEDVTFTNFVQPIKLPFEHNRVYFVHEEFHNVDLHTTGWGSTDREDKTESLHLMAATIKGMKLKKCQDMYNSYFGTKSRQLGSDKICAGSSSGINLCTGDSGDPLIYLYKGQPYLIGIAVGGISCYGNRPEGVPVFFSRVDMYEGWIMDEMNK